MPDGTTLEESLAHLPKMKFLIFDETDQKIMAMSRNCSENYNLQSIEVLDNQ
jgi:hypothetical protein